MAETTIVAEPGVPQIVITRAFAAPRELLYRAHVEPELLVRWLGPSRLTMTVESLDARHGGAWRFVHRESGGTKYSFHGLFHGDPSPDGIVRTFEDESAPRRVSLETTTFEERGGATVLRQSSVFQTVEDRDRMVADGMEVGVEDGLKRLEALLAALIACAGSGA